MRKMDTKSGSTKTFTKILHNRNFLFFLTKGWLGTELEMITPFCKHQQKTETSLHAAVRYLTLETTTQTIVLTLTLSRGDVNTFGGVLCTTATERDKALEPILPQHTGTAALPMLASSGAPGQKVDGHRVGGHSSSCYRMQSQTTRDMKEVQPVSCWR